MLTDVNRNKAILVKPCSSLRADKITEVNLYQFLIYCSTLAGWFEEVHKFGFKSRYIHPFMFRMDTGHYSQVGRDNLFLNIW
jgi:hypothetical protein